MKREQLFKDALKLLVSVLFLFFACLASMSAGFNEGYNEGYVDGVTYTNEYWEDLLSPFTGE